MNERLKKAYGNYATLAMKYRNTKEGEICLALHTDNESVGEVRLVYSDEDNTVYAEAVYPDGRCSVLTSWSATDDEVAAIIGRSDPERMRQFMLEMIVRKDVLYSYNPEEENA